MGNKRFDQILNEIVGGKPELPSSDKLNDSGKVSAGDLFAAAKDAATAKQEDTTGNTAGTTNAVAAARIEPPKRSVPDLSDYYRKAKQISDERAKQREDEKKQKALSETQKAALNASDSAAHQSEPLKPSVNAVKPVSGSGGGAAVSDGGTVKISEPKLQTPVSSESSDEDSSDEKPARKARRTIKRVAGKLYIVNKTPTQKAIEEAVGEK